MAMKFFKNCFFILFLFVVATLPSISRADNHFSFDSKVVDAANNNNIPILTLLLDEGTNPDEQGRFQTTALHRAAFNGHNEAVALLVSRGADINARDFGGATPLHMAARNNHASTVRLLVEKGVDVDAPDNQDYTPLHRAISADNTASAVLFLEAGANPNNENSFGNTPLMDAVRKGNTRLVEELLVNGAEKSAKNRDKLDVIDFAMKKGNDELNKVLATPLNELKRKRAVNNSSVIVVSSDVDSQNIPEFLRVEALSAPPSAASAQLSIDGSLPELLTEDLLANEAQEFAFNVQRNRSTDKASIISRPISIDEAEMKMQADMPIVKVASVIETDLLNDNIDPILTGSSAVQVEDLPAPTGLVGGSAADQRQFLSAIGSANGSNISNSSPTQPVDKIEVVRTRVDNNEFLSGAPFQHSSSMLDGNKNNQFIGDSSLEKAVTPPKNKDLVDYSEHDFSALPPSLRMKLARAGNYSAPIKEKQIGSLPQLTQPDLTTSTNGFAQLTREPVAITVTQKKVYEQKMVSDIKPAGGIETASLPWRQEEIVSETVLETQIPTYQFDTPSNIAPIESSSPASFDPPMTSRRASPPVKQARPIPHNINIDTEASKIAALAIKDGYKRSSIYDNPVSEQKLSDVNFNKGSLVSSIDQFYNSGERGQSYDISKLERERSKTLGYAPIYTNTQGASKLPNNNDGFIRPRSVQTSNDRDFDRNQSASVPTQPVFLSNLGGNNKKEIDNFIQTQSQPMPASLRFKNYKDSGYVRSEASIAIASRNVASQKEFSRVGFREAVPPVDVISADIAPFPAINPTFPTVNLNVRANRSNHIPEVVNVAQVNTVNDMGMKMPRSMAMRNGFNSRRAANPISQTQQAPKYKNIEVAGRNYVDPTSQLPVQTTNESAERLLSWDDMSYNEMESMYNNMVTNSPKDSSKLQKVDDLFLDVRSASPVMPKYSKSVSRPIIDDVPTTTYNKSVSAVAVEVDSLNTLAPLEEPSLTVGEENLQVADITNIIPDGAVTDLSESVSQASFYNKATSDDNLTGMHAMVGHFGSIDEAISFYNSISSRLGLVYNYKVVRNNTDKKYAIAIGKLSDAMTAEKLCSAYSSPYTKCEIMNSPSKVANDNYKIMDIKKVYSLIGEFANSEEAKSFFAKRAQNSNLDYRVAKVGTSDIYLLQLGPVADGAEARKICEDFNSTSTQCKVTVK